MSSRPASRVEVFDVLAPAGTAIASPLEVLTPFIQGDVVGIELVIPAGHNGLTGIRLAVAHAPVIPRTSGAWLIGNNESIELDTIGYPSTGAWSAFVYNRDQFDHTFHVRYLVADFVFTGNASDVLPEPTPVFV